MRIDWLKKSVGVEDYEYIVRIDPRDPHAGYNF